MLTNRGRVRVLREEAHSQKVAEAAIGLSTDNGKRPQKLEVVDEPMATS